MTQAITVAGLGKRYRVATAEEAFPTLRESLRRSASAFGRRLRGQASPASDDEFWALREVSFQVERGDRVAIVGRNGAGKSTLLKILSRITEPSEGRVEIAGRVASLLEVGTGFHPDLTGRENVFLNGAIMGMRKVEIARKFDEIVAFAEIERFLDTPVKRYSTGMFVRLAFAVAAHLEPEILIIDEVLAVGDAGFQRKCIGKMQDVSRDEARTVLFVSHNLAAIEALCTHAILLEKGRVVAQGLTSEVVASYLRTGGSARLPAGAANEHFELFELSVGQPGGLPPSTFKPLEIAVRFRARTALIDAGARFLFEDLSGAPILGFDSSDFVQRRRAEAGEELRCVLRVPSLPLAPGAFRLRLWLTSAAEWLHWEIPTAWDVTVEESAVYGSRRLERGVHGAACAPAAVEITGG